MKSTRWCDAQHSCGANAVNSAANCCAKQQLTAVLSQLLALTRAAQKYRLYIPCMSGRRPSETAAVVVRLFEVTCEVFLHRPIQGNINLSSVARAHPALRSSWFQDAHVGRRKENLLEAFVIASHSLDSNLERSGFPQPAPTSPPAPDVPQPEMPRRHTPPQFTPIPPKGRHATQGFVFFFV